MTKIVRWDGYSWVDLPHHIPIETLDKEAMYAAIEVSRISWWLHQLACRFEAWTYYHINFPPPLWVERR